jgi:hypothetical protein
MTTLADLEAQRAQLVANRSAGIKRARFADQEVTFRTDKEMAAAIAAVDREIAALQGRRVRPSFPPSRKDSSDENLCGNRRRRQRCRASQPGFG